MPSTYTLNDGFEQPATGEQSGTWGQTVDNDLAFIDSSLHGVQSIALGATTYTLQTTNGASSLGRTRAVVFTGTPGGTATVTVAPSTAQKCYFILNNTNQSVIIQQGGGAGTRISIPAGQAEPVYCDGTGANANVAKLHPLTSDQLTEGTINKFYLDSRARAVLSAGFGMSYNAGTGVIAWASNILHVSGDLTYNNGPVPTVGYAYWGEAWQAMTPLTNSWIAGTQAPRYRMATSNILYFDGSVSNGTAGTSIFTLPAGRRPARQKIAPFAGTGGAGGAQGTSLLTINTDGTLVPDNVGYSTRWLNGVNFTLD